MITAERLRELLSYDPETGVFTWRVQRSGRSQIGSIAGSKTKYGVNICIDCGMYRACRLAWLYMTGEWPIGNVIPLDGDCCNLRWSNLRAVTPSERRTHGKYTCSNRTGHRGVFRSANGAIRACIRVNGKGIYLGSFDTVEAASAAYQQAAREHFGEFARVT